MNYIKKVKLSSREQLQFFDYLKSSLENGFSLNSSIELMPVLWPQKRKLMQELNCHMKKGSSFDRELLRLGFSKTTASQVNLALQQGSLVECLQQLAKLQRLKNEQIQKLKTELSYPFVLAIMMVFLLLFMQNFVLKQLSTNDEHTGDWLIFSLIVLFICLLCLFAYGLKLLAKQDYRSLKQLRTFPFIGKTIQLYVNYLLVYDIGLLLANGFSLQKMCLYAGEQEKGSLQHHLGQRVGRQLQEGRSLEEIIKKEVFLPDTLLILLKTGSQRKNLSQRCLLLGKSLFKNLLNRVEKLVVNVQPLCFILLGLCIVGMYLKLLLPMYAMMQGISN